ncbi:unnamed protein product [Trifolium pratense]|uniref:Uncharacterized protein n=1 Tax=Trifolium pratense TaxID=57577 RepID=A0ACB0LVS2_TRIPR|nr:unnamed protein product [Trifolium pratense]
MTRRKVKLSYIIDNSKRRATFIKRKKGLIKKIDEITTLCGVEGCAIIFSQNDPQPAIWPSPSGVHTVLSRFRSLPELEQSKKMQNQESYLMGRIRKGEEQLNKLRNENRKNELTQLMFQCLNAGKIIDDVNMNDVNGLYWLIEQNMKKIERHMEETQAATVVENRAENVIGSVQGMENNVGAMQTQHLSLDFMTNNNFGDVLPFVNGNNEPNGNRGENVIGSVHRMENNIGAMQTQHLSLDFMTNNNFGDVLPFENGNNVPNGLWL